MSSPIRAKLAELQEAWRNLLTLSRARKEVLNMAHTNQKFVSDLRELELWVADTVKKMDSSELPTNIAEAKAALELHHERKVGSHFFHFVDSYIITGRHVDLLNHLIQVRLRALTILFKHEKHQICRLVPFFVCAG